MLGPGATSPHSYLASLPFDRRLALYDIRGSIAHARMLGHVGILAKEEAERIVVGLTAIGEEVQQGTFPFDEGREDIHMAVEARLIERLGPLGGKLHTARSRNDQVALDLRLYLKDAIAETLTKLKAFQGALLGLAEKHLDTVIPGYTHLQRAQPILLAHHLLAYVEMAQRDRERLQGCLRRTDVLPLGSGALAGVPYPIDRDFVARELGFSATSANSIDAVADRDFVVEYQAAASMAVMHLSRLAEEIVLWSSEEFGFVRVGEEYASGSSIMPQKRNPDIAELARGKTGRVYGHLFAILTTLKGLPLAYNRDLQEDKEGLFDTVDTLLATLDMMAGMVRTLAVDPGRTRAAAEESYLLATDVADHLVAKDVPFREAHEIVSRLVTYALEQGKYLHQLSLEEYRHFSPRFADDVTLIDVDASITARRSQGGTARQRVEEALAAARRRLEQ